MNPDLARKAYEAFKAALAPSCWDKQTWERMHPDQKLAWGKVAQTCYEMGYSEGCADGYDAGARGEWF